MWSRQTVQDGSIVITIVVVVAPGIVKITKILAKQGNSKFNCCSLVWQLVN